MLAQALAQRWWVVVLRGVIAVLFGLAAFFWPGLTGAALVLAFGAYAFVDGVFALAAAIGRAQGAQRWALLLEGVLGIAAGLAAFFWPGLTALTLIYLIAVWAIVTGVFEIIAAVQLRREIDNEWALGLSGVLSIVLGGLLIFQPGAGGLALLWIIGGYALAFGVLLIIVGFRLRGWKPMPERDTKPLNPMAGGAVR